VSRHLRPDGQYGQRRELKAAGQTERRKVMFLGTLIDVLMALVHATDPPDPCH
jgi:hypothetical protein